MRRHLDRTIDTLKGMAPTTPPPETCPLIDGVLRKIEAVMHDIGELRLQAMNSKEPIDNEQLGEDIANALLVLDTLTDPMESIRHHNARLRNLSLYWYRTAKQLHEEAAQEATRIRQEHHLKETHGQR